MYKQNHPKYKTLEIYGMIYGVYVMTFQSDEALIPDYWHVRSYERPGSETHSSTFNTESKFIIVCPRLPVLLPSWSRGELMLYPNVSFGVGVQTWSKFYYPMPAVLYIYTKKFISAIQVYFQEDYIGNCIL